MELAERQTSGLRVPPQASSLRARRLPDRISPDAWAVILIVLLVLAANAIYLLHISDPNPLGGASGLGKTTPGFVKGLSTIDPNVGFTSQPLGHRAMLDLVHGHLPWWNPYEATGTPLAGEMQSGALFPPNILLLLSNGQLYLHVLLELVAGTSTYFLLRRLGLAWCACIAGAAAFALNGTFSWLQHAAFNPVAFLPLALLGIERARAATLARRAGGWRLLALAGALSFIAGFPETTYLDTLLVVVWFAWRVCEPQLDRSQRGAFAIKGAAGGAGAALLAAPLLVAFADFGAHAYLGRHAGARFASVHLPSQGIAQLLVPYLYGPISRFGDRSGVLTFQWHNVGGYITMMMLLLAGWGLMARGKRGLRILLAVWIVLVFARMYGQVPLLGHVLGWLPAMGRVEFFRYAAPTLEFAVILLAALGINDVIRDPRRGRVLAVGLGSFAALAVVWQASQAFRLGLGPGDPDRHYALASLLWGTATLLLAVLAAAIIRSPRARGGLLAALLAVDALAMFVVPELSAPRSVRLDPQPVRYLARHLGTGRFFTLGPLTPDYGSYYGLPSVNVNDVPTPANFAAYVSGRLDPTILPTRFTGTSSRPHAPTAPSAELLKRLASYRAAGVSYVLTPPGQRFPRHSAQLILVDRTASAWIYRLTGAAPLFGTTGGRCQTRSLSVTSAGVDCPAPATLFYRETAMPGWSATVDGRPVSERSRGLFQSVRVPRGRHTVSFEFRPPGILWAELAFLLGVVGLAIGPLRAARRRPLR